MRSAKRVYSNPTGRANYYLGFRVGFQNTNMLPSDNSIALLDHCREPTNRHHRGRIQRDRSRCRGYIDLPPGQREQATANNSLFTLDTNGTLKTATTFDFETNASTYSIRVQAKDEFNATVEGNFTVMLTNLNEPPANLSSTVPLTIAENQPIGTVAGIFNATDPDANASLTYHFGQRGGGWHPIPFST